jgi:MFS family permease
MSWLERAPLAQAIRPLLIYAWYLSLPAPDTLETLGWNMLMLIVATVGIGIIVQIIFVILSTTTGQEQIEGIEDERDKMIEALAMVRAFTFVGLGFLGAVLALWYGWGAVWAFNIMLGGMVACDVAVNLLKFWRYARG